MNIGNERVRPGRQNAAGFKDVVIQISPPVPQSRKRKQRSGRQTEVVRLFFFGSDFLPLEKAVRRNEAAVPFDGVAEGWLLCRGF